MGVTKQHVHLFDLGDVDLQDLPNSLLNNSEHAFESRDANSCHYSCFMRLEYNVVLRDPLEESKLSFPWPIGIHAQPGILAAHFTTIAKNIRAHLEDPDRTVVRSTPDPSLDDVLGALLASLPGNVSPLDLNRGIKSLWSNGRIDAPAVQYKKAISTSRNVMDEDYLVKRDDPELYNDLQDKLLFRTHFKFLDPDAAGMKHFSIDPSTGVLVFPTYSADTDSVSNVIQEILAAT